MEAKKKTLAALKANMPKSDFHEKMAFHEKNEHWLNKSFEISLTILDAIDEKGWNQTQLAEKLGVSRQRVSKMLKGQENFRLSTLVQLEEVLGIEFVQVDGLSFSKRLTNYLSELTNQIVDTQVNIKKQKTYSKSILSMKSDYSTAITYAEKEGDNMYVLYDNAA